MKTQIKINYENFKEYLRFSSNNWNLKKLGEYFDFGGIYYYTSNNLPLPSWLIIGIKDLLELTPDEVDYLLLGGDTIPTTRRTQKKYEELGRKTEQFFSDFLEITAS